MENKFKEWPGMDNTSTTKTAENKRRRRAIVAMAFVVPKGLATFWG